MPCRSVENELIELKVNEIHLNMNIDKERSRYKF